MIYHIGEYYRYNGGRKRYKLIKVDRWLCIFECGHTVMDSILRDFMTRCSTGGQVYNEVQLSMFNDGS